MKRLVLLLSLTLLAIACNRAEKPAATATTAPAPQPGGDAARGKALVTQYGCNVCHMIPGAEGASALGPNLAGLASRPMFANGTAPTNFETLTKYIVQPAAVNPQTSMPPMGVTEADAKDIAGYLLTLK